jgi:hypothetical protein
LEKNLEKKKCRVTGDIFVSSMEILDLILAKDRYISEQVFLCIGPVSFVPRFKWDFLSTKESFLHSPGLATLSAKSCGKLYLSPQMVWLGLSSFLQFARSRPKDTYGNSRRPD